MIRSTRFFLALLVAVIVPQVSLAQGSSCPTVGSCPCACTTVNADSVKKAATARKLAAQKAAAKQKAAAQAVVVAPRDVVVRKLDNPEVVDVRVAPVHVDVSGSVMLTSPTVGVQAPQPIPTPLPSQVAKQANSSNNGWIWKTGVAAGGVGLLVCAITRSCIHINNKAISH